MLAERESLARRLGLPPDSSDHDVVASAYRRWGDALVDRLRGEFAFAIVDRTRRRVLLVRDHLGVRPLLYRPVSGGLLASCGMPPLLAAPWGRPEVDETYVAHYLAGMPQHDGSVYQGIHRVPAGCAVVVGEGRVLLSRYWRPDLRPTSLSIADAAEALREGLERAMVWRLARGACAVTLSGGLDSTTVYGMGRSLGADLTPYSLSFPGWSCDETAFIESATAMYGDEARLIDGPGTSVHDFIGQARRDEDIPCAGDAGCYSALLATAARDGRQLILTGFGGDTVFCGFGMTAVDLARRGHFARARRARGRGETDMVLARSVARFVAESGRFAGLLERRRWRARRSGSCMAATLADRVDRPPTRFLTRARLPSIAARAADLTASETGWTNEAFDRLARRVGLTATHPLLDLGVVDVALRLPDAWFQTIPSGGGRDLRGLHRRAFGGLLPRIVQDRRTKAEFTDVYHVVMAQLLADHGRGDRTNGPEDAWIDIDRVVGETGRILQTRSSLWPVWLAWTVRSWGQAIGGERAS